MIVSAALVVPDRPPQSATQLRKLPALLTLSLAVLCLLGASSFVQPEHAAEAAVIKPELRAQLEGMSTGSDQPLLVTGETAVARNALIPISSMPVGRMTGFTQVTRISAGYDTALKCLTQAIYYEAANEPELGKRGVAQVVLNRLRHPAYPNSVCGVVYEGANQRVCQFSFTCDGSLLRTPMAKQWNEAKRVAQEALMGATAPEVGTATNYHADYVVPRWAFTLGKLTKIGRHIFYRLPGSYGAERAFTDRWTGAEHIPALNYARLHDALNARTDEPTAKPALDLVPGLNVTREVSDRHAAADVGGRLDTTTTWRLTIPDPSQISSGYRNAVVDQGAVAAPEPAPSDEPGQRTPVT